jgi:hypothetical protein
MHIRFLKIDEIYLKSINHIIILSNRHILQQQWLN